MQNFPTATWQVIVMLEIFTALRKTPLYSMSFCRYFLWYLKLVHFRYIINYTWQPVRKKTNIFYILELCQIVRNNWMKLVKNLGQ